MSSQIFLLAFALATDASIISFAFGLIHERDPLRLRFKYALLLSFVFGFFQFAMFWFGGWAGHLYAFSQFGFSIHLFLGLVFFALGGKCFLEAKKTQIKEVEWALLPVFVLAFATSVDALASGVGLGTLPQLHFLALIVGGITFFLCLPSYFAAQFFKSFPDKWLLRLAGVIFIFLGAQVFWSVRHLIYKVFYDFGF